jgi:glycerol-3-phosphate dehydrogenase
VLAFFDDTGRLFYVIPMGGRSVIGTTDTRVDQPRVDVDDSDRAFLLDQINARLDLERPLTTEDIIAERCGVRPLVVEMNGSDEEETDWTKLSRKHVIELDTELPSVSIFGGKLTDCLNVGEEVAEAIERLGIELEPDRHEWYGEPDSATRQAFFRQAELMELDDLRNGRIVEPLSDRLWRRYGTRAFAMLDMISTDPAMGQPIMAHADYLRVELEMAAGTEMITRMSDFMRRRSKISQVVYDEQMKDTPGLLEVAQILFGDAAQARLDEYWDEKV